MVERIRLVVEETDDGILRQISTIEEHISLIREPGGSYLGHVSPSSSDAESFSNAILDFCYEKTIDLSNLDCVGCDGCPTNPAKHNGIIRRMEKELERPLQWVIYQLHGNELPFRHLFEKLDGKTTGCT